MPLLAFLGRGFSVSQDLPASEQQNLKRTPNGIACFFFDGPGCKAAVSGASDSVGGVARAHQRGSYGGIVHALQFSPSSSGHSSGHFVNFLYRGTDMEQLALPLLMRHNAPRVVHPDQIAKCSSYRDAVKLCWSLRRVRNMTRASLAEHAGLYAPHVSKYLNDGPHQRDLPGDRVRAFEVACDNTAISQYISRGAQLTVVEELQARNAA